MSVRVDRSSLRLGPRELVDLAAAWLALGVAFAVFLNVGTVDAMLRGGAVDASVLVEALATSLLTVGVGFLLHELAHKVVAVHFGQVAEFRANYRMLGFALLAAPLGILFAAPGAVYHRGRITDRENGLIALAGPLVNVVLAVGFLAVTPAGGFLGAIGDLGFQINLFLAAFNMLPWGPLDGRKVLSWSPVVFAVSFAATAGPGIAVLLGLAP